jgi:predicted PurR-regulated permease PerM
MADKKPTSPETPTTDRRPRPALDVFTKRLLVTTVLILGLLLAWTASDILLLVFGGLLLGILLRGLAVRLARITRLPEHLTLVIVVFLILLCIAGMGWFMSPNISAQITQLQAQWPQLLAGVKQQLTHIRGGQWLYMQLNTTASRVISQHMAAQSRGFFITTVGTIGSTLLVIFMGLYVAYSPTMYVNGLLHLVPPARRPRVHEFLDTLGEALFRWVVGRLIGMVALGIILSLGLWLLGVNLPVTLALIAAILDFVPYVGPILATVPAVLVALLQSPAQALYVLALYVLALHLEGYLIEPFIERKAVYLPPALTLVAQMLMYQLFGFLGMFLAMPLMATLYTAVRMAYVEDILGDKLEGL